MVLTWHQLWCSVHGEFRAWSLFCHRHCLSGIYTYQDNLAEYNTHNTQFNTEYWHTVSYKTKFGSQNFGYQIWFCTSLINTYPTSAHSVDILPSNFKQTMSTWQSEDISHNHTLGPTSKVVFGPHDHHHGEMEKDDWKRTFHQHDEGCRLTQN